MTKITAAEAFEMIRNSKNFGKYKAVELVNGDYSGEYFAVIDEAMIQKIVGEEAKLDAYTYETDHGAGLEGGKTKHVRILDGSGHGFEETWAVE